MVGGGAAVPVALAHTLVQEPPGDVLHSSMLLGLLLNSNIGALESPG